MTAALKTACAWAFVSSLPNGVNTKITEHGGGLSEGQAQRISIARALLCGALCVLIYAGYHLVNFTLGTAILGWGGGPSAATVAAQ